MLQLNTKAVISLSITPTKVEGDLILLDFVHLSKMPKLKSLLSVSPRLLSLSTAKYLNNHGEWKTTLEKKPEQGLNGSHYSILPFLKHFANIIWKFSFSITMERVE